MNSTTTTTTSTTASSSTDASKKATSTAMDTTDLKEHKYWATTDEETKNESGTKELDGTKQNTKQQGALRTLYSSGLGNGQVTAERFKRDRFTFHQTSLLMPHIKVQIALCRLAMQLSTGKLAICQLQTTDMAHFVEAVKKFKDTAISCTNLNGNTTVVQFTLATGVTISGMFNVSGITALLAAAKAILPLPKTGYPIDKEFAARFGYGLVNDQSNPLFVNRGPFAI